jgi:hypothetical protein
MHCPYCPKNVWAGISSFSHELSRSATTATQQVHTKAPGYLVGSMALATRANPDADSRTDASVIRQIALGKRVVRFLQGF